LGGPADSVVWDFGDGTSCSGTACAGSNCNGTVCDIQSPTHIYRTAGYYPVSLTLANKGGVDSEQKDSYVNVWHYNTHTISASANSGGSVTPTGNITVIEGKNQTFSINPQAGYHIVDVLVDGISAGAVNSYTFFNISAGHAIEAIFSNRYAITSSVTTSGGIITPNGITTVDVGANLIYDIKPDAINGYYIADVRVDGKSVGAVQYYQFDNITANRTIEAIFSISPTHTITVVPSAGGTVAPGTVTVINGSDRAFAITPAEGYHIVDVMLDNMVSLGAITSYAISY
jgi:PKD repeat protein